MLVKPGLNPDGPDGLHKVRIPHSHALLPTGGQDVPDNRFWRRRLRDGDVIEVETAEKLPDAPRAEPEAKVMADEAAETHAELANPATEERAA